MLRDNLKKNQKPKKTKPKNFQNRDSKGKLIKYKFILNMHKHVDSDMNKSS